MAAILQGGPRDTIYKDASGTEQKFTLTNFTEDFDMDCDTAADATIADVLGTLIQTLIRKGIINGTVSA